MFQLKRPLTKKTFDKEIDDFYDFYRFTRLKVRFKDAANHHHFTEEGIFKKPSSKYLHPSKKHHPVQTFIKATNNDIDATIKKLKQPKCSNLSEKEQKPLEEVKVRDEIIITNPDKRGAVVILDLKNYVEECERQLYNAGN